MSILLDDIRKLRQRKITARVANTGVRQIEAAYRYLFTFGVPKGVRREKFNEYVKKIKK